MPIRRIRRDLAGASLAVLALNACVPRAGPPALLPIVQVPSPSPLPPPAPPAPPPPTDWATGPLSPGDWHYTYTMANFSAAFQSGALRFLISCERDRAIRLYLIGAQSEAFVIRTSFGMRRLPANRARRNEMLVTLPASDPLLEQMAFSRGRFLVTAEGGPSLVLPAWPEFARVIEDCRGE